MTCQAFQCSTGIVCFHIGKCLLYVPSVLAQMFTFHYVYSVRILSCCFFLRNSLHKLKNSSFETLSKLKQNDPEIYDPGKRFFNEKQNMQETRTKKKQKEKPMFLRDYEREMLLKTGGVQNEGEYLDTIHMYIYVHTFSLF